MCTWQAPHVAQRAWHDFCAEAKSRWTTPAGISSTSPTRTAGRQSCCQMGSRIDGGASLTSSMACLPSDAGSRTSAGACRYGEPATRCVSTGPPWRLLPKTITASPFATVVTQERPSPSRSNALEFRNETREPTPISISPRRSINPVSVASATVAARWHACGRDVSVRDRKPAARCSTRLERVGGGPRGRSRGSCVGSAGSQVLSTVKPAPYVAFQRSGRSSATRSLG